jgi:hypothetical protein
LEARNQYAKTNIAAMVGSDRQHVATRSIKIAVSAAPIGLAVKDVVAEP